MTEIPLICYYELPSQRRMDIQPPTSSKKTMLGTVTEALPDTLFRVQVAELPEPILAYLAGKMRMNHIRVIVGDKVELEQDQYGGRARIVRRM